MAQLYMVKYLKCWLGVTTTTSGPVNSEVLLWNFYHCKYIGIPTCTQHLLTLRRPADDRLKKAKHVASYTIKIVVLEVY